MDPKEMVEEKTQSLSSHLRRLLGPALGTLKKHKATCDSIGDFEMVTGETRSRLLKTKEYIIDLEGPTQSLTKTLERVNSYIEQWRAILDRVSLEQYELEKKIMDVFHEKTKMLTLPEEAEESLLRAQKQLARARLAEMELKFNMENNASTANLTATQTSVAIPITNVKLPALSLPTFNGEPTAWPQFIQRFRGTIHRRNDLNDVDKLNYLIGLLEGDAKKMVQGYQIRDENYSIVMETLEKRFGDDRVIVNQLIQRLNTLTPKGTSIHHTKAYLLEMDQLRNQLKQYKRSIGDDQYWYLIESRIPKYLVYKLHDRKRITSEWNNDIATNELFDMIKEEEEMTKTRKENPFPVRSYTIQSADPPKAKLLPCLFCNSSSHRSYQCHTCPTVKERRDKIRELHRCYCCLQPFEKAHNCGKTCRKCNGSHNQLICDGDRQPTPARQFQQARGTGQKPGNIPIATQQQPRPWFNNPKNPNFTPIKNVKTFTTTCQDEERQETAVNCAFSTAPFLKEEKPTLPVVPIRLTNEDSGEQLELMAFLDSGSEKSYIRKEAAQKLGLENKGTKELYIKGLAGMNQRKKVDVVEATVNHTLPVTLFATETLVGKVGYAERQPDGSHKLRTVTPDLLIGSDYMFQLLTDSTCIGPNLKQFETDLGTIILHQPQPERIATWTNPAITGDDENMDHQLQNLWKLENLGFSTQHPETVDEALLEQFKRDVEFDGKRYTVKWLWNEKKLELSTNFGLAFFRLQTTMRKLEKDPELKVKYKKIFDDQLQEGIIEKVTTNEMDNVISYVPHQAVIRPDKATTKIRVVFDCSASPKGGISLNDALHQGPLLLPQLVGMILRFRHGRYVTISDVKQAFHQLGLQPSERDAVRFLLPKDWSRPVSRTNFQVYRFTRVLFGATCSPSLLALTIRYHLERYHEGQGLIQNIYVDNVMEIDDSEEDLKERCQRTKDIFANASMELREYYSNSDKIMKFFNPEPATVTKFLGHPWKLKEDTFVIQRPKFTYDGDGTVTKRMMVSHLGKFYDPLGLLSPTMLPFKRILQKIWDLGISWDDPVPQELVFEWTKYVDDVKEIEVPRMVELKSEDVNMAVFCDASSYGFGIAAYVIGPMKKPALIFAKSRLFPSELKKRSSIKLTIPRKEITSMYGAAKVAKFLMKELPQIKNVIIYSDSQVAIQQLLHEDDQTIYVRNRVRELQSYRKEMEFRFIDGKLNPADIASRGAKVTELMHNELWWKGPEFLLQDITEWPSTMVVPKLTDVPTETTTTATAKSDEPASLITKDMNWKKLINVTKHVICFINKCRPGRTPIPETPQEAGRRLVRAEQEIYPPTPKFKRDDVSTRMTLARGEWTPDWRTQNERKMQRTPSGYLWRVR
ncbi:unnamed protein product [Bursaphelenchus xylophilus]|uniref:(pine wood nematode) hypothetical protein n=1 Tax=Bursaphelenchus xylophilus TaxID=6326 RepID=A0A811KRN7_BURXY|nr:unnamed protein product [Bursaphelenchus xylophilus]CAG9102323.1 unnamed protein product [Bursaphelenchus xylophilus]